MSYPLYNLKDFAFKYQMRLAHAFYDIEQRGVLVDTAKLAKLREFILEELGKTCVEISKLIEKPTSISKERACHLASELGVKEKEIFNVQSDDQVKDILREAGLKVPKDRFTGKETTGKEKLKQLLSETGHPVLRLILRARVLSKVLGTNVNVALYQDTLYCSYRTTGTVGGRRSSSISVLGYGSNLQNQPRYSEIGKKYRECIIARPGKIFIKCDQSGAEDWIVQGIIADVSGDRSGLDSLSQGDRHRELASFLFSKPEAEVTYYPERFLGKKTRHAGQYDEGPNRMSEMLAGDDFIIPPEHCAVLLEKFHQREPNIRGVFHKYIQAELIKTRTLVTPFGRTRVFYGLRPYADNKKIFKEAYSYIPQSTVGDNTGFAILELEALLPGAVLMDEHDGVTVEVPCTEGEIKKGMKALERAFDRTIKFPRGLEIKIPIEIEVGFDLEHMQKCESSGIGLTHTLNTLREPMKVPEHTTYGAELQSSVPL